MAIKKQGCPLFNAYTTYHFTTQTPWEKIILVAYFSGGKGVDAFDGLHCPKLKYVWHIC